MTMQLISGPELLMRFGAFLSQSEALDHLVLARALAAESPARGFAVVTVANELVLAAALDARGKWALGRLHGSAEAATALAETVATAPGTMGPRTSIEALLPGLPEAEHLETHLFQELRELRAVSLPAGCLRRATMHDEILAGAWMTAFFAEALPSECVDGHAFAQTLIAAGDLFLLEAGGEVVAMAGKLRPCLTGIAIAYVYTPHEARGKGYGTAITAALCRHLLVRGWSRIWLFTIAGNPVSNHVYAKLGFRVLMPFEEYRSRPEPNA